MAILADQHMHSEHSFDSEAGMDKMIESAINKGLNQICFTEHNDYDYPVSENFPKDCWNCNVDAYLYDLLTTRDNYEGKIKVNFGLEVGLQESCVEKNQMLVNSNMFDFIIGSIHLVNKIDTYEPVYFEGKSTKQAIDEYFEAMLKNIKLFNDFDVLGHMDYIVRTLPAGEDAYKPSDYTDYIESILDFLIKNGKGIEINTSALVKGFKMPNPHMNIIKRYKEKGGEIITVGSDAHTPENIAGKFNVAEDILKAAGFDYYTVFKYRIPTNVKL